MDDQGSWVMELQRLFDAVRSGDKAEFRALVEVNPDLLDEVALAHDETPLHTASKRDKLDFVKMIMELKPKFAEELDKNGFSPMHLAAANGSTQIVKELLNHNPGPCHKRDRDDRTPLHWAAIKGRLDVMHVLLSTCPESAPELTAREETARHLTLKNNQCHAFKYLLGKLKEHKREELVNCKDRDGNTVLHLATSRKQQLAIEDLLPGVVQVNCRNYNGLTALDLLHQSPYESDDKEIKDFLRRAGAVRARDVAFPPLQPLPRWSINTTLQRLILQIPMDKWPMMFVVLEMVIQLVYRLANSPPKLFALEYSRLNSTSNSVQVIMGYDDASRILYLMTLLTVALVISIVLIIIFLSALAMGRFLVLALFAILISYGIVMDTTMPKFFVICGSFHISGAWFVWFSLSCIVVFICTLCRSTLELIQRVHHGTMWAAHCS